jgi:hypothetical protein
MLKPHDFLKNLKYLIALQLWHSGLSQAEIRMRLGLGMNAVNEMLKGVRRGTNSHDKDSAVK